MNHPRETNWTRTPGCGLAPPFPKNPRSCACLDMNLKCVERSSVRKGKQGNHRIRVSRKRIAGKMARKRVFKHKKDICGTVGIARRRIPTLMGTCKQMAGRAHLILERASDRAVEEGAYMETARRVRYPQKGQVLRGGTLSDIFPLLQLFLSLPSPDLAPFLVHLLCCRGLTFPS